MSNQDKSGEIGDKGANVNELQTWWARNTRRPASNLAKDKPAKNSDLRWFKILWLVFSGVKLVFVTMAVMFMAELVANQNILDYETRKLLAICFIVCTWGLAWLVSSACEYYISKEKR